MPKMRLESFFQTLFFKLAPETASRYIIKSMYRKNQEDLTFRNLWGYYVCKTVLQAKKMPEGPISPQNYRLVKKLKSNAEEILRIAKRSNLYGKDEKIYDYPSG